MAKFKTSPKVLKALDEVCKELAAMPEEELMKLLDEHKDGFYATAMGGSWMSLPRLQSSIRLSTGLL